MTGGVGWSRRTPVIEPHDAVIAVDPPPPTQQQLPLVLSSSFHGIYTLQSGSRSVHILQLHSHILHGTERKGQQNSDEVMIS